MTEPERQAFSIEPLSQHHDLRAFCCGNALIDKFCREDAHRDHRAGRCRVFVALDDGGNVIGFYSLLIRSLEPKTLINIGYGKRDIPALYLAMIGVSEALQRQKLGTALMVHAFEGVGIVAERAGVHCLWLEAVDEIVAGIYEGIGFQRFGDGTRRMYMTVASIRAALAEPGAT